MIRMELKEILEKIENFGCDHPSYWGCAIAGEVGELCNIIKKHERDGISAKIFEDVTEEIADVFIYTVLIARYYNIDFEKSILDKLDKIALRRANK